MDKVELSLSFIYIVGSLVVLLIPACATIFYNIWSKNVDAINRNTMAIVKLENRLDILWQMTQDLPRIRTDVDAAHSKLRHMHMNLNKDKDGTLRG